MKYSKSDCRDHAKRFLWAGKHLNASFRNRYDASCVYYCYATFTYKYIICPDSDIKTDHSLSRTHSHVLLHMSDRVQSRFSLFFLRVWGAITPNARKSVKRVKELSRFRPFLSWRWRIPQFGKKRILFWTFLEWWKWAVVVIGLLYGLRWPLWASGLPGRAELSVENRRPDQFVIKGSIRKWGAVRFPGLTSEMGGLQLDAELRKEWWLRRVWSELLYSEDCVDWIELANGNFL